MKNSAQVRFRYISFPNFDNLTEVVCDITERHDAIFVVGSLDETIMLRGMRYHPIDIENSVIRSHRKICER